MDTNKLASYMSRVFVAASVVLFVIAVVGWLLDRIMFGYEPGRLIEFAAMSLMPVVVTLLRQIREEVKRT
jgi:F0F1-type ATP synthase assembly protein I